MAVRVLRSHFKSVTPFSKAIFFSIDPGPLRGGGSVCDRTLLHAGERGCRVHRHPGDADYHQHDRSLLRKPDSAQSCRPPSLCPDGCRPGAQCGPRPGLSVPPRSFRLCLVPGPRSCRRHEAWRRDMFPAENPSRGCPPGKWDFPRLFRLIPSRPE